jgi:long-subunit acyl-CoA synthetase (AMP-forming)
VVAVGDARPFVVALMALDREAAAAIAERLHIDGSPESLAANEIVRSEVQDGVDKANAKLSRVEQVKYFSIVSSFWDPGGDELTPTAKLKRRPIADKYRDEIERIYAEASRARR